MTLLEPLFVTLTVELVPPASGAAQLVRLIASTGVDAAAWLTVMVWGEPETPDVVAVTVTVALRAVPVLAATVMVKLPGVLPLAAETVSQVWFEVTV